MYLHTYIFPTQHMFQSEGRGGKLPLEDEDAKDVAATATTAEMSERDMDSEGKTGTEGAWRTRESMQ